MSTQPPPRKGAFSKHIINLHREQFTKVQIKNNNEIALLEDIKSFTKQKLALEKHYAESLHKLLATHIAKKNIIIIGNDVSADEENVFRLWHTYLKNTDELTTARLTAVKTLHDDVEKDAKTLKSLQVSRSKKCLDRLQYLQKDIQCTISELDRTKKIYFNEESEAVDLRDKAKTAEDKARGRKKDMISLFQSKTTLMKHAGKLSVKQEEIDIRSTGARNDYILSLATANAHQNRYFKTELQEIVQLLEGNVYEKISGYLKTITENEVNLSSASYEAYNKTKTLAETSTRSFNFECNMKAFPALSEHVTYVFENSPGDTITTITPSEHDGGYSLNYEAKQNASKLNQAVKTIKAFKKRIDACYHHKAQGLKREPNDTNGPDLDTKIMELQTAISNAQTEKAKALARLEKLKEGGIVVEEFIDEYFEEKAEPRSDPVNAPVTEWAQTEPTFEEAEVEVQHADDDEPFGNNDTTQAQVQDDGQNWATWDDAPNTAAAVEEEEQQQQQQEGEAVEVDGENVVLVRGLYNFVSQNADELTISENEEITVLMGQCDEEGWVFAINSSGQRGVVPRNYLQFDGDDENQEDDNENGHVEEEPEEAEKEQDFSNEHSYGIQFQASAQQQPQQVEVKEVAPPVVVPSIPSVPPPAFSSSDEWSDEEEEEEEEESSAMVSDNHATNKSFDHAASVDSCSNDYCRALYDYEATGSDEISFEEGDIIKVLQKDPNGLDDGWWLGELKQSRQKGLFPAIVVEEYNDYDDSMDEFSLNSPPSIAPPSFAPPDILNAADTKQEPDFPPPPPPLQSTQPSRPPVPPAPAIAAVQQAIPPVKPDKPPAPQFQPAVTQVQAPVKPVEPPPPIPQFPVQPPPIAQVPVQPPPIPQAPVQPPPIAQVPVQPPPIPQAPVQPVQPPPIAQVPVQPAQPAPVPHVQPLVQSNTPAEEVSAPPAQPSQPVQAMPEVQVTQVTPPIPEVIIQEDLCSDPKDEDEDDGEMEIVVTAPTPLVMSPNDENDEVDEVCNKGIVRQSSSDSSDLSMELQTPDEEPKCVEEDTNFPPPPEELKMKQLKKLETMKESPA